MIFHIFFLSLFFVQSFCEEFPRRFCKSTDVECMRNKRTWAWADSILNKRIRRPNEDAISARRMTDDLPLADDILHDITSKLDDLPSIVNLSDDSSDFSEPVERPEAVACPGLNHNIPMNKKVVKNSVSDDDHANNENYESIRKLIVPENRIGGGPYG
ncbi:uncharacterized protein LOC117167294 isoform X2 [Belonocnema kinseyi]|uniref:uncharacterized protein LOC117167294 isoform X2 n=1 Tax=Belonocnema kinseyi TaxID=2817044 RepID=UPI00143D717B|nr:uncharacterized protein LOC117167294 isoform X2 [Belonocnema kinseyi]